MEKVVCSNWLPGARCGGFVPVCLGDDRGLLHIMILHGGYLCCWGFILHEQSELKVQALGALVRISRADAACGGGCAPRPVSDSEGDCGAGSKMSPYCSGRRKTDMCAAASIGLFCLEWF